MRKKKIKIAKRKRRRKVVKVKSELSGLHVDVKKWLKNNKLYKGFKSEQRIGRYKVDEVDQLRKIIIEVNGDHWHANPDLYNPNDVIGGKSGMTAEEIWAKEEKRTEVLEKSGYKVVVVWEQHFRSKFMRKVLIRKIRKVLKDAEQGAG